MVFVNAAYSKKHEQDCIYHQIFSFPNFILIFLLFYDSINVCLFFYRDNNLVSQSLKPDLSTSIYHPLLNILLVIASSRGFSAKLGIKCKFLTWRHGMTVCNISNQSTFSVLFLWLSEAFLQWAPPISFHVFTFEE